MANWLLGALLLHDALLAPLTLGPGMLLRRLPCRSAPRGGLITLGALTLVAVPVLIRPGTPANPSVLPPDYPRDLAICWAVTVSVTVLAALAPGPRRVGAAHDAGNPTERR